MFSIVPKHDMERRFYCLVAGAMLWLLESLLAFLVSQSEHRATSAQDLDWLKTHLHGTAEAGIAVRCSILHGSTRKCREPL